MITKRIIACLDVHDGRVVKGVQFVDLIDAGDPATQAARHAREGADEIVLLDITATHEGRQTLLDTVRRTARELFVPFAVGGGIRTADDAAQVFEAGADKVSVNSAALADPTLIDAIGRSFGAQAVVVAIDARRDPLAANPYAMRRSTSREAAALSVEPWWSGPARLNSAAQARFCLPQWIPMECAPASIAN